MTGDPRSAQSRSWDSLMPGIPAATARRKSGWGTPRTVRYVARRYRRLVQSKIVVTRPPPIFRPLHQPFPRGIQLFQQATPSPSREELRCLLSIIAPAAGERLWVRDVEVEVRAFFLICCTLLNVLVRKGKGPEGRKNLAQGASPGSRKPSGSREPQRGERKGLDAGTLPGSAAPSGA